MASASVNTAASVNAGLRSSRRAACRTLDRHAVHAPRLPRSSLRRRRARARRAPPLRHRQRQQARQFAQPDLRPSPDGRRDAPRPGGARTSLPSLRRTRARSDGGHSRNSQRYSRIVHAAAGRASAVAPPAPALPVAALHPPRPAGPDGSTRNICGAHPPPAALRPAQSDRPRSTGAAPGTARRSSDRAGRPTLLDVLADRIAVRGPVAEREQDVKRQIGQRGSPLEPGVLMLRGI